MNSNETKNTYITNMCSTNYTSDIIPDDENIVNNFEMSKSQVNWLDEVKNNIKLKNNISFFEGKIIIENGIKKGMQYGTGDGKTYNSAYFALYCLLYTDKKVVIATTKNENVEDLLNEMVFILKKFTTITKKLKPFLGEDSKLQISKAFLRRLNINKMVSYNQIEKESFQKARIIITNHSYFYPEGDSSYYLKNMINLKEALTKDDFIIIDEADEFETSAYITILMNNYLKIVKTPNGPILKTAKNCFVSRDGKFYTENIGCCRYELPEENTNIRYSREGDFKTPTYSMDRESIFDMDKLITEFYFSNSEIEDIGRRIGFTFEANKEKYKLMRVYKAELLKPNNLKYFNIESDDILKLIHESVGSARCEQIIKILDIKTDEVLFKFDNRHDFMTWCIQNMSADQYDKFLTQLMHESSDLYKKYLIIRRNSILDQIEAVKYYITATPYNLENIGYSIERGKSIKVNTIKKIDVFFINRTNSIDKLALNLGIECMSNYKEDINCLTFCAEKRNVSKIITDKKIKHKYKDKKYCGVTLLTGINDGNVEMSSVPAKLGCNESFDFIKEYSKASYLNGPEATGKNYKEVNLGIINTRPEINAKGRLIITKDKFWFVDIEEASFRTIIQAGGRIERADQEEYKALILIGENESIVEKYINEKTGNGIKYNHMVDKTIGSGDKHIKNKLIKIFDHIKCNVNANFEEIQENYNNDSRENSIHKEILHYFNFMLSNEVTAKEAKKQTMYKFGIARNQLNLLIRKGFNCGSI